MTLWEAAYDPPSRSEIAEQPPAGPELAPEDREALMGQLTALQRAAHEVDQCPRCGERCDICGERMCAEYGPEPAIACGAHHECTDCHADNGCSECRDARRRSD